MKTRFYGKYQEKHPTNTSQKDVKGSDSRSIVDQRNTESEKDPTSDIVANPGS